jgi:long-chain acyl-CoA synthetase
MLIMERLYAQVAERPDHTALVYREEQIGWAELVERIERLAHGLAERGIGPGDAVGIVLRDDPWFVTCCHAVTALGAVVVPVNPAFKQAELEFCFRSADVRCIVSDERTAGVCERIAAGFDAPVEVITTTAAHGQALTLEELVERSSPGRLPTRDPHEVFVHQFSSGSTGRPKRVERTHGQIAAEASLYGELDVGPADRVLSATPLFHTWGMGACLLGPAAWGATVVILEDPNPFLLNRHRALKLIERERVTVFPGVPFHYRLMAEAPGSADLSSLRLCFSAGTALARETFDAFGEKFGVLVRQLYGSTETGFLAANLDGDPVATFASVGAAIGDVQIQVVDEAGAPLPTGEVGEVTVASPAMTSGYADLPEVNAVAFAGGRFQTGDLGMLDDDGRLTITGRRKLLIEVGGYKVDPIEVEDVVGAHPKVAEAVVVGVPGNGAGEIVKAVIVSREQLGEREVADYCRERLANYKVPQVIELRDEIPKSPLGKVLRKYLV